VTYSQSEFGQDNGLTTEIQGPTAKLKGAHRFLQGRPKDCYRSYYLKITL